jgi:uncharacterized protein YhhL (DUF1145 family)
MSASLIFLCVYVILLALLLWLIDGMITLREPFHRLAKVALMVIGVLLIILYQHKYKYG